MNIHEFVLSVYMCVRGRKSNEEESTERAFKTCVRRSSNSNSANTIIREKYQHASTPL